MKLLIVHQGMSMQQAYEMQEFSLLNKLEIDPNMSDEKITKFLNIVESSANGGKIYGIIDDEAIPIENVGFIKEYYARVKKKSIWKFWKKDKPKRKQSSFENSFNESHFNELQYTGGDGSTRSSPVILNCSSMPMARELVNRYLSDHCQDGWKITFEATDQVISMDRTVKKVRRIVVSELNGNEKTYYFDFDKPMSSDINVNSLKRNIKKNLLRVNYQSNEPVRIWKLGHI